MNTFLGVNLLAFVLESYCVLTLSTFREVFNTTAEDVSEVVMVLLRTVIQCVATRSKVDKNAPAMVTNMVSMFRLMTPSHFSQYIQVLAVNLSR